MHILTPGKGRTGDYDFTLNPYRGCSFGCSYCYAAFFVADEERRQGWGKWVEVKVRAAEALRRHDLRGKRIYMSTVTDPYQPIEAETELTRSVLSVLLESQARVVVQTRSPLVTRDIDLFRQFDHLRVNVSITTDCDEVRKQYEPGCASIERRLEAVQTLKAAGVKVGVCVAPMLPLRDPSAFGRRLGEIGPELVTSVWFRESTRPFASSTREGAVSLAQEHGWTREGYDLALAELRRACPRVVPASIGFAPV
jgi:DNA repair photolyase